MSKPLDEQYLVWLYSQVGSVYNRNPSKSYWRLLKLLYNKEFLWIIPNDDNRAEDGRDLRVEFIEQRNIQHVDRDWMRLGCSMLELLIGLSRRLAFEAEGEPRGWFWKLMENIGLAEYNDHALFSDDQVNKVLDDVILRTYKRNGAGGLFPLKKTVEDQREVELWYQMNAYVVEKY